MTGGFDPRAGEPGRVFALGFGVLGTPEPAAGWLLGGVLSLSVMSAG